MKLADFGISVQLESKDATRDIAIGTTGYIPPEMLKNLPYGLPADIWSLGCLMYSLLAMRIPFHGKDEDTIRWNVVNMPLNLENDPLVKTTTPQLQALLKGMLTKESKERLTIE